MDKIWNTLLLFGAGWWVGNQMVQSNPIIPANVTGAQSASDAVAAAAQDIAAQVTAQTSDGSAVPGATPDVDANNDVATSAPPLVASAQDPSASAPPAIKDTGMTVNNMPVCIDSFNNLVDCTTGAPLDDASAEVIINALQTTKPTGPVGRYRGFRY